MRDGTHENKDTRKCLVLLEFQRVKIWIWA
jgi:hypothetical protein